MSYPEQMKERARQLKPGRSASHVLRELGKEFADEPLPNEREIYRWCNPETAKRPPAKRIEQHRDRLADIAGSFLEGELDTIAYDATDERHEYELDNGESLTREELINRIEDNIFRSCDIHKRWLVFDCLASHLESGHFSGEELLAFVESKPVEFIEIIRTIAHTKILKGTCSVCEGWQ